jgi:predicted membrane-bound dolichyl-phosphate-mannose-protein mannosyltransferase
MNKIKLNKSNFYADYFWSLNDGSEIREDVFVKTYLQNYFTFKDFINLYKMIGKEKLLKYAKEINQENRIEHLIDVYEKYI